MLNEARALLARGWCQGMGARDDRGRQTWVLNPHAARYCLTGAVRKAAWQVAWRDTERGISRYNGRQQDLEHESYTHLQRFTRMEVAAWNDQPKRQQAEVLTLLDQAIAALN